MRAVDDLSFTVRPGAVTGFLGPNGAGKTTTLRMLLGLTTPTSGTAIVGDRPYVAHPTPGPRGRRRAGGVQLPPRPHRPGPPRGVRTQVGVDRGRCREVLELVGLADAADRRVGGYSMGMRQRLGLATALLGDPPVVVLDEPANGLDPEGIVWMRALLRRFAAEGRTVLVSSHVLAEVQHTVDDVVIIARGRLVHASSLADLADAGRSRDLRRVARTPTALRALCRARGWTAGADGRGLVLPGVAAAEVGAAAHAAGLELHQLASRGADLEEVFLRLTGAPATGRRRREGGAASRSTASWSAPGCGGCCCS